MDKHIWSQDDADRAIVHGLWHSGAAICRGSPDEWDRAKEQFDRVGRAPSPDEDGPDYSGDEF